ncbi:MAG TPA: LysR substrate-binding domain-containing protein, partial [Burkholderiaceae bacterium]
RDMLGAMERMHAELSEFATGVHGSVRVMASVSVLAERLPDDIGAFLQQYQSARVTLDEALSPDIVRHVREGSTDLGVLWDVANTSGLHTVPYRSDHLCVVVNPSHPLAKRKRVRFEETLDYAAIGVAPGGTMETLLRRQAAMLGRALAYRIQVASLNAACRIVAARLGLAVLPREAVGPDVQAAGLVQLPLHEPWVERRFVVCSRAESTLSATARLLMQHLRAQGHMPA